MRVIGQAVNSVTPQGDSPADVPGCIIDQSFAIGPGMDAFVGAETAYQGNRLGPFTAGVIRQNYSPYTKVNFYAGIERDAWRMSIYANNVGDARGALSGGFGSFSPSPTVPSFYYITPRTIGVTIVKEF